MKKYSLSVIFLFVMYAGYAQQNNKPGENEQNAVLYMREEEKLARDVYNVMFEKWGGNPFDHIRKSEQVHMDRMLVLVNQLNLEDPVKKNEDKRGVFTNTSLQQYYDELVLSGSKSLTDALKAGAKIEELDISDLIQQTGRVAQQNVITTFKYLKQASENHLRAFVRRLKMQGVTYEPVILSKTEYEKIAAEENNHSCMSGGW
jgi:hypothetical protein